MGVSKNKGTPKWWFIMENLIKMDDLGGKPTIFGNIQMIFFFKQAMGEPVNPAVEPVSRGMEPSNGSHVLDDVSH